MSHNTAQSNRALMPKVTEFVDAVREVFGECKVTFASENGVTRGKQQSRGDCLEGSEAA